MNGRRPGVDNHPDRRLFTGGSAALGSALCDIHATADIFL